MSTAIDHLAAAQRRAIDGKPRIGGFPYLAETLRQAGVTANVWHLPCCQSIYFTQYGAVVQQSEPLATGMVDVAFFNEDALIAALRADQAGTTTFHDFLAATWRAGVIRYDVDLTARCVTYFGALGECYREPYPEVSI